MHPLFNNNIICHKGPSDRTHSTGCYLSNSRPGGHKDSKLYEGGLRALVANAPKFKNPIFDTHKHQQHL